MILNIASKLLLASRSKACCEPSPIHRRPAGRPEFGTQDGASYP